MTAIDAETGTIKWKVQSQKRTVAAFTATAGGLAFTADPDGPVRCTVSCAESDAG